MEWENIFSIMLSTLRLEFKIRNRMIFFCLNKKKYRYYDDIYMIYLNIDLLIYDFDIF